MAVMDFSKECLLHSPKRGFESVSSGFKASLSLLGQRGQLFSRVPGFNKIEFLDRDKFLIDLHTRHLYRSSLVENFNLVCFWSADKL